VAAATDAPAVDFETWKAGIIERIEAKGFDFGKLIDLDDLAPNIWTNALEAAASRTSSSDISPNPVVDTGAGGSNALGGDSAIDNLDAPVIPPDLFPDGVVVVDVGFVDHDPYELLLNVWTTTEPQAITNFVSGSDRIGIVGWDAVPEILIDGAGSSGGGPVLEYDSASGTLTAGEVVIAVFTANTPLSASDFFLT
jgi:hypothetical protein